MRFIEIRRDLYNMFLSCMLYNFVRYINKVISKHLNIQGIHYEILNIKHCTGTDTVSTNDRSHISILSTQD